VCILLAGRQRSWLWVAANRDEQLQRPWEKPGVLVAAPPVFGGRDLVGGGSWLAVNLEAGLVVGVTNARRGAPPGERSRGRLVVDVAAEAGLPAAVALLTELDLGRYGAFNLLVADGAATWLATNEPVPLVVPAGEDVVAIGNDALDRPSQRVAAASIRAAEMLTGADDPREALAALLADHGGEDPLCRHGAVYGTVCSSLVGLGPGGAVAYRFAAGPPCATPWEELETPLPHRH